MRSGTRQRWQGLDGLRALAVIAVVVYHFSPGTLPGGFLGVDVFFVISGYLITRLITNEFLITGRIDVPRFYLRRARRLLPALGTLLVAITVAALIWRDQLSGLRSGVLSSAAFVANWWLAFRHQSYFAATGRPSMLQHLWSLGVEEQFYLVWPVVVAATLAAGRRRSRRRGRDGTDWRSEAVARLAITAAVLSVASTTLMWVLADHANVPYGADGSTLYFGTDTHCMGLLLGAALGAWTTGERTGWWTSERFLQGLELAGFAALGVLTVLIARIAAYSHSLYRGDFFMVSLLVTVVIAAATPAGSLVGRALDVPVLRWVGVRSYSIYLWHWPIAVITRPGIDTPMPAWVDQVLRTALTLALADLSYRLVESPVRRLGFGAAGRLVANRVRVGWRRLPPAPAAALSLAGLAMVFVAAVVIIVGPAAPHSQAASGEGTGGRHLLLSPPPSLRPTPTRAGSTSAASTAGPIPLPKLSGFGDSVLLGARHALSSLFPGGSIDAVVGRQPGPILADVRTAARDRTLEPLVVLDLGNNGLVDPAALRTTLHALSGATEVLVFNDHLESSDHEWQKPNNATFAGVVPGFPNARLVDWNAIASRHRGWLYPDDLHLNPSGSGAYAKLVAASYRSFVRSGDG